MRRPPSLPSPLARLPHDWPGRDRPTLAAVPLVVGLLVALVAAGVAPAGALPTADAGTGPEPGVPSVTAPAAPGAATAATGAATTDGSLHVTYVVSRTPNDPGHVDVTVRFGLPDRVTELETRLPDDADVTTTDGFRGDGGVYEWDGTTRPPTVTYRKPVNVTVERGREGREVGGHLYAETGSWALVRAPAVGVRYRAVGTAPEVNRTVRVDGPGVAGDAMVFLGASETRTRTVAGQRLRLVVPEAANLAESPGRVFDSVGYAAERLPFGEPDPTVTMFVAPTDGVRWGTTGLQRGDSDLWVRDLQRVDTTGNVWIHEYVHTRQGYRAEPGARWTYEAAADYYAALYTYEQGDVGYETFRRHLREGRAARFDDAVLVDPATWTGEAAFAHYWKGALVMGALDRQLRVDDGATLGRVLERVGGEEDLTESEFLAAVEAAGGSDARAFTERHTRTTAAPEVWNRTEHRRAFGPTPAFAYEFVDPFGVDGPYRTGELDGAAVPNETLGVTVVVRNVGDATGSYTGTLRANGARVGDRTGTLGPGERETLRFDVPVSDLADLSLTMGEASASVPVRPPATVSVASLSVPDRVGPDEPVSVRVRLTNEADRPAARALDIRVNGEPTAERTVRLSPGESTTVEVGLPLAPGEHRIAVGDRSTLVVVSTPDGTTATTAATPNPTRTPGVSTPGNGAGFGVVAGLAALLTVGLLAWRRG